MYTRALISSARTNNFKFRFLSLCHAHNLQLHITTDEEAAASKRMVFYDFYVYQRKKNNSYLASLSNKLCATHFSSCFTLSVNVSQSIDRCSRTIVSLQLVCFLIKKTGRIDVLVQS